MIVLPADPTNTACQCYRCQAWPPKSIHRRWHVLVARAFRVPVRLIAPLPPVPVKAAHRRRYTR